MSVRFDFADRVVLITGASGSLGGALARAFHAAGATVCATARRDPEIDGLSTDDERFSFYPGDLADEAAAERVVEGAVSDHGRLDALANVAGTWRGGAPVHETDVETFELLLDANLRTAFLASKHAVPHLRETEGSLVSVSARSALRGGEGDGAYRAAKAGVRLLTETIAEENADAVRANAVLPNVIDTPANREAMPDADHESWPTPSEIADVFLLLCSDAADVTSGASVPVYGDAR